VQNFLLLGAWGEGSTREGGSACVRGHEALRLVISALRPIQPLRVART